MNFHVSYRYCVVIKKLNHHNVCGLIGAGLSMKSSTVVKKVKLHS